MIEVNLGSQPGFSPCSYLPVLFFLAIQGLISHCTKHSLIAAALDSTKQQQERSDLQWDPGVAGTNPSPSPQSQAKSPPAARIVIFQREKLSCLPTAAFLPGQIAPVGAF